MKKQVPPETPATLAVARLDADGVYHGIDHLPADQVTADHVPLPDGCDLPPGCYRWDRASSAFVPLAGPQQRAVEAPVALNALAWGLLAMHGAGLRLPPAAAAWLDVYVKTIDFGVPGTEIDQALLHKYMTERALQ